MSIKCSSILCSFIIELMHYWTARIRILVLAYSITIQTNSSIKGRLLWKIIRNLNLHSIRQISAYTFAAQQKEFYHNFIVANCQTLTTTHSGGRHIQIAVLFDCERVHNRYKTVPIVKLEKSTDGILYYIISATSHTKFGFDFSFHSYTWISSIVVSQAHDFHVHVCGGMVQELHS